MVWKKYFKTKDEKEIVLRNLSRKDSVKNLMNYINSMINERVYFALDKKKTYKEEKAWKKDSLKDIKKGNAINLILEHKGRIIGDLIAHRQREKFRNNIVLGVGMLPRYRNQGIGYFAMKELIERAKKEMKPKNICLTLFSPNKPAKKLYAKLGFVHHHTLEKWSKHKGKFIDEEFLILKK